MDVKINLGSEGKLPSPEFFSKLEKELSDNIPKIVADKYKELILANIDSNKYGFKLSHSWVHKKVAKGYDLRPFIASGEYVRSIDTIKRRKYFAVGFKSGARHKSGLRTGYLARLLEFGVPDRRIPARPLWRRTTEDFIPVMGNDIKKYLNETVARK